MDEQPTTYGPGIQIGGSNSKHLEQVTNAIAMILTQRVSDETMQDALNTLREAVRVENVTISNCTVNTGPQDQGRSFFESGV